MTRRSAISRLFETSALRLAVVTGTVLAMGAVVLSWVNLQHSVRLIPTQAYVILIAVAFTGLGGWVGHSLTTRQTPSQTFLRNEAAMASLGITAREYEVLTHIAGGRTNKEIARQLGVSPNTIKTQAASLFAKLSAARRTDAVRQARGLSLIP